MAQSTKFIKIGTGEGSSMPIVPYTKTHLKKTLTKEGVQKVLAATPSGYKLLSFFPSSDTAFNIANQVAHRGYVIDVVWVEGVGYAIFYKNDPIFS